MDVHVGTYIIKECLTGYLKGKTRIMTTHNLDYLKYVDYIYIMKKGRIVEQGTYKEINSNKTYQKLLDKYHKTEEGRKSVASHAEADALDAEELKETLLTKARSSVASRDKEKAKEEEKAKEKEKMKDDIKDDPTLKKLVLEEDRQTGKVDLNVYKAFYNYYGGFRFFAFIAISMIFFRVIKSKSNLSSNDRLVRTFTFFKLLFVILDKFKFY